MCPYIHMELALEGGRKSTSIVLAMGVTSGVDATKSDKKTIFSDNARVTIAENWSAQLDESYLIQKVNN